MSPAQPRPQLGCCVTRQRLCPVTKGVARQPGATQPLPNPCARPRWDPGMLFHSAECSEMLRIGDTCRTSKFFTYRLAEVEYTNGEWLPGRSPSLKEAAKPPKKMGRREPVFQGPRGDIMEFMQPGNH